MFHTMVLYIFVSDTYVCVHARAEAFFDWLVVDFWLYQVFAAAVSVL